MLTVTGEIHVQERLTANGRPARGVRVKSLSCMKGNFSYMQF